MLDKMTIGELEEMIADAKHNGADEDTPVHVSYGYGDHWNTQVAPQAGSAEMLNVERSDYHQMDKLTEDDGEMEGENSKLVFVIS
jgi:hypothetical protein